jgi:zinc protease
MRRITSIIFSLIFVTSLNVLSEPTISYKSLNDKVPNDTSVLYGKLENGLTYYIKSNKKPENRADLQIVINAGSVLEDDDQKGLAHFTEHMCFNGTKNFPKQELVSFLESTGMRFGADVNASTGFDQTYYTITIPLDKEGFLEKGMQVLEDWAHNVSFEADEIEKERGVILEEWRLHKGANERIMMQHFPTLLYKSKYTDRLPIGDTSTIKHAPREFFMRYYEDWYRPNLMAIIVVGDINKNEVEKMIKERFSGLKNPPNPRVKGEFPIQPHDGLLISVAKDKEMPMSNVNIYFKDKEEKDGSFGAYKMSIMNGLVAEMFNQRLQELTRKAEPPFLYGGGQKSNFIAKASAFMLVAATKNDAILKGMEALLTEAYRAKIHGFTATELERAKKEFLRRIENSYAERDKTPSDRLANEYFRNFTTEEPIPGIEYELALTKKFIPEITLEELNQLFKSYIKKDNVVMTVSAPDKENIIIPTENEIRAKYDELSKKDFNAYVDQVANEPLFTRKVTPGTITSQKDIKKIGVTELKLSNGVKVFLKPTDFKNDEIQVRAYSPGGTSLASNNDYLSAEQAAQIITEAGVSKFDANKLDKMMAGKVVGIRPYISDLTEGFQGSAAPEDIETMFQLVNLYFTEPRMDYDSYESYTSKLKESIKNADLSPDKALRDTFNVTMAQYNYRERPMSESLLKELDPDKAYNFYKNRFADASDFTFIFVGNFDVEKIKPFITQYIASLPATNRKETWKDLGVKPPKGVITKKVYKGMDKKSSVMIALTGPFEYTRENRNKMQAMGEVFNILLRESIREEKGGVYGIGARASSEKYPYPNYSVNIRFGCDPTRSEELIAEVKRIMKVMREKKVDKTYLQKAKEILIRGNEVNLKENSFWVNAIYQYDFTGEDLNLIGDYKKLADKLTLEDIQNAAKKYLTEENLVQVVLYPEK